MSVILVQQHFVYSIIFFFLLIFNHPVCYADNSDDCTVHVQGDPSQKEPLLLSTRSPPEFIYPSAQTPTVLKVEENEHLRLTCKESVHVHCKDNKFVMDAGSPQFNMKQLECPLPARHMLKTSKQGEFGNCPSNVVCEQIGFQINLFDFVPTIEMIYLNPGRKRPLWAHITIVSAINYRQKGGESSKYVTNEFFKGIDMEELYDKKYQKKWMTKLLGSQTLAKQYITESGPTIFQPGGEYLVRGQLIDNEDFFYKTQQDTVHYYSNVMPMWKSVAENNWRKAGDIIRKLAGDTRSNIELWSGTIDTMELKDVKGKMKSLYLTKDDNGNELVPVPKLLFKYAYDQAHNRGVVIITVNDPFIKKLTSEHIICPEQPLCHKLYPYFKLFQAGYTYCCSLQDFATIAKRRGMPNYPHAQPLF